MILRLLTFGYFSTAQTHTMEFKYYSIAVVVFIFLIVLLYNLFAKARLEDKMARRKPPEVQDFTIVGLEEIEDPFFDEERHQIETLVELPYWSYAQNNIVTSDAQFELNFRSDDGTVTDEQIAAFHTLTKHSEAEWLFIL